MTNKRSESREAETASSEYPEEVGQTINPEFELVYNAFQEADPGKLVTNPYDLEDTGPRTWHEAVKRSEGREAVKARVDILELQSWVANLEGSLFILQHLGAGKKTRDGVKKQIRKLNKRIAELQHDF